MIASAKRVCREALPVGSDVYDEICEGLGDMFLNRESYVSGDWILTLIETG